MKKIRADESISAWLYLALLHASTSHVLPDPFSGVTGTEMSLQLLQSANCWSSRPYDDEAISTLRSISNLSPKRNFYPPNYKKMQIIDWPIISSTLAAHEAFQWIVKKLIDDSFRLSFTYISSKKEKPEHSKTDLLLSNKAYHRNRQFYSNSEQINSQFVQILPENLPVLCFDTSFKWQSEEIIDCRKILAKIYLPSSNYSLEALLFGVGNQSLRGIVPSNVKTMRLIEWFQLVADFRNCWITLYDYFRSNLNDRTNQTILLSFLAYQWIPLDHLIFLQRISINYKQFQDINPPHYPSYNTDLGYVYNRNKIIEILRNQFIDVEKFKKINNLEIKNEESLLEFSIRVNNIYETEKNERICETEKVVMNFWNHHNAK